MTDLDPRTIAHRLVAARAARRTLSPLTDVMTLDVATAYRIQAAVTDVRLERGERIVGWKLGYTSAAMREQMGIAEPNFGPLTDAMLLSSGDPVPAGLLQPRVEPEIGLRLRRPLDPSADIEEVMDSCDNAFACLEVVDSVWKDYRFRLEDNTADGSSAAHVVVGDGLPLTGLDALAVTLFRNGAEVGRATGAAAGGHPALGMAWLAAQLAARGTSLEPGMLVITGGLTTAVPLDPGDLISARFASAGVDTTVTVTARPP